MALRPFEARHAPGRARGRRDHPGRAADRPLSRKTPHLSPKSREAWELFVRHANWSQLHPYDWRRFYDFVRTVHRYQRAPLTEQDIQALALAVPDPRAAERASYLGDVWRHCWGTVDRRS